MLQERDTNNLPQVTYTRGNDLSGTLQGAGGIGGLLARTANPSTLSPQLSTGASDYYHSDGNGNVTFMVNSFQQQVAKYLYDPYGNTLAESGLLAEANRYRSSSKEWNASSGLHYYGCRFYDPNLQRWLNRDPFLDEGSEAIQLGMLFEKTHFSYPQPDEFLEDPNLYDFVINDPIDDFDNLGLSPGTSHPGPRPPSPPGVPPNHPINPYRRPHGHGCVTEADCKAQYSHCIDVGIVVCVAPPIGATWGGVAICGILFHHLCDWGLQQCEASVNH